MTPPEPLSVPASATVVALAHDALEGRLAICAGAGLSRAEPCGLPDGSRVAELIHERAAVHFALALECVAANDLVATADAIAGLAGGMQALQHLASEVAHFTTAKPNLGHQILALLVLEGITVLITNWDDCIERAWSGDERVLAVVTDADRLELRGALLYKVHGCATRPSTLLLSSEQLDAPPGWAAGELHMHLGASRMVFVGVGDIAGYVERRIKQFVESMGDPDHLFVASRSIHAKWPESAWRELVPGLAEDHRLEQTADEFLDEFARGWVQLLFAGLAASAARSGRSALEATTSSLVASLMQVDAPNLIAWLRSSALAWPSGATVVHHAETERALLGLGAQTGGVLGPVVPGSPVVVDGGKRELLITDGHWAGELEREARRRAEASRSRRYYAPGEPIEFICSGQNGALPNQLQENDIMGDSTPHDVVDGQTSGTIRFVSANDLIASLP